MRARLRKWWALFGIWFQDGIAYRASGLIWIMTDLATAVTMPLVWARASRAGDIAGFATSEFVLYYLCLLLLGSFVTSHIMWDVAMEIKEGRFSTDLVRPIGFHQATFFRNLSWRIIRTLLFTPIFLGLLVLYRGYLTEAHIHLGWTFWASLVLGHLVSFTFVMTMAMLAFYTQEVMAIFELYYIPQLFLSGTLFPIALLPEWARNAAMLFPFYFTVGAPTEVLIGRVAGHDALRILAMQVLWIFVCLGLSKVFWHRGLHRYTGVGL